LKERWCGRDGNRDVAQILIGVVDEFDLDDRWHRVLVKGDAL
jgi:hypothetical protein